MNVRRPRRLLPCVLVVSGTLLAALAGAAAAGCGSEGETSGRRVVLSAVATASGGPTYDTAAGFRVELTRAEIAVGALSYFDGEPLFVRGGAPSTPASPRVAAADAARAPWPDFSLVRVAHAHPGHYVAGQGRGETPAGAVVPLLGGAPTALPRGEGVTGAVRSATFRFGAASVSGGVVALAGRATRGADAWVFSVVVGAAEVLDAAGAPDVVGCIVADAELTGPAEVKLVVDPAVWLGAVDFADAPRAGAASDVLAPASVARRGIVRGLRSARAYRFEVSPTGS